MQIGTYPTSGFAGAPPLKPLGNRKHGDAMYGGNTFKLCELRADWQHHVSTFKLQHYYNCNRICHCCKASRVDPAYPYTDFTKNAAWLSTIRTHREFLLEELGEPNNGLIYVKGFHYVMLKFDSMHTVNLGTGLFTNGSALFELFKLNWFPGPDKAAQWRAAYVSFKTFLAKHKIQCSQPQFRSWMLVLRGEEYCYFSSKAFSLHSGFS